MKTVEFLKQSVLAVNKILKERVGTMGVIGLLHNYHPVYREDFARLLYKEEKLTKEQFDKFIKIA